MSRETEEFFFNSITHLKIELAMPTVHQRGVCILTFTEPGNLLILARPTFSELASGGNTAATRQGTRSRPPGNAEPRIPKYRPDTLQFAPRGIVSAALQREGEHTTACRE